MSQFVSLKNRFMLGAVALFSMSTLPGCTANTGKPNNVNPAATVVQAPTRKSSVATAPYAHVRSATYTAKTQTVILRGYAVRSPAAGEDVIDITNARGTMNYIFRQFPTVRVKRAVIYLGAKNKLTFAINQVPFPVPRTTNIPAQAGLRLPPKGVSLDRRIVPIASMSATVRAKRAAVLKVAASKLGTPYIWGHSEDRGQYGFDCSNFTAYVYHHALGYIMSGESEVQYHDVGTPIPVSAMQVGDLIIFNHGSHVGIYAGHQTMIEEGGGLGKVGYLSVAPNSKWGSRITVVKRVF